VAATRVLVVDDELPIRRALRSTLTNAGYEVQLAASGEAALDLVAESPPDLVILDLMLPGLTGLEVCRELRAWAQVPIIVLSAQGGETLKIEALDLGADDYLTKPFGRGELLARIRAALRRVSAEPPPPILESGALRLDSFRHLVTRDDQELRLTPTEFALLRYLMANAGRVLTHRLILQAIWGSGHEDATHMLRVFVAQLRQKIEPDPARPTYIRTEPGIGYRFRAVSE
jgi:two-component system, OmpR family, KDP operon response regulator KdpE